MNNYKQKKDTIYYHKEEWWILYEKCNKHKRPIIKKEDNFYHPEEKVNESNLKIELASSHNPIYCVNAFIKDQKLFIKFNTQDSVKLDNLRIYVGSEKNPLSIKDSQEYLEYFESPVCDTINVFRVSCKDGISYEVKVNAIPVITAKYPDRPIPPEPWILKLLKNISWKQYLSIFAVMFLLATVELIIIIKIRKRSRVGEIKPVPELEEELKRTKNEIDDLNTKLTLKENELSRTKKDLEKEQDRYRNLKGSFDRTLNEREVKINEQAQKEINKAKEDANKAKDRAEKAEKESKETEQKVTEKFSAQITGLNEKIGQQSETIDALQKDVKSTNESLSQTRQDLDAAQHVIENKEKALSSFKEKITDVQPAGDYAKILEKLLKLGREIEDSAIGLLNVKNIDDYLITKYITRFHSSLGDIDMNQFATDVLNVANVQFVYNTQPLANYNQKDRETFDESMKEYFFSVYLKKYIDAIYVLNETMAGLSHLIDGLSPQSVAVFSKYREDLNLLTDQLDIKVLTAKIFDSIANNVDLKAEMKDLDFDCPIGTICQINNCIVFRKGANKPNEQINVIVKK